MADITERIEKQMEGTNLALAAVAEILQKMDGRLEKEEYEANYAYEAEVADAARMDLVKSIAEEVIAVLKADQGMDVSGDERKAKSTGGTPQNADDSESAANPTTKIEEQQKTIQAMLKNHIEGHDEDDDEDMEKAHLDDDEEMEEKGGMAYKAEDDEDAEDEAADMPKKGYGNDEDEDDDDEMKSMAKQLNAMRKQLEATEANMQKAIATEAENRLRKMGFKEENGLQAPKITSGFGLDDSTPLVKSDSMDTVDQLASMSYTELRNLQHQIETGNTDGVPRELLG
jgi:hypothetical protein